MISIPLYAKDCEDFSTNGICLIQPIECTVSETANGLYELTMEIPINTESRFYYVVPGTVVKVPTPARESPLYELEAVTQEVSVKTVTRTVYKVGTKRTRLRQKASSSAKTLAQYKKNTEVTVLNSSNSTWWQVSILKGGAVGYMRKSDLVYSRTITDTITQTRPVTQNGIQVEIARDQLFRIYSVENDTQEGIQTARALHIFYDLRYDFINATYSPQSVAANTAANQCFFYLKYEPPHSLYTSGLTTPVSGEFGYKNFVEAILDPDEGILPMARGRLFRDNFDVFLMKDEERDMGVTVRRGKNLIGVTVTTDDSEVVTQIQPCGKDASGNDFFLVDKASIDSPKINDYPTVRAKKVDYDITYDPNHSDPASGVYNNATAARTALTAAANADFAEGADEPSYGMEVDFALLENTLDASEYTRLQAVHLFDTVTVIDELIGLTARLRVTSYKWNVLSEQYESVSLGDIQDVQQTTYSYNIADGSVSWDKVQNGTTIVADGAITTVKLAQGAVTFDKISSGAKDSMFLYTNPVGTVYASSSSFAPALGTWSSLGSEVIGSTTVYYYLRTA